ncbi:sulfatase-like hydrolase/transferase [Falsirhodobacter halotolerans]|uniref:sulfatase-like hydrolase/transferase n=1 Tax=Falsirhodobacter halotolerans TaxID=1146892 RepID=UPI001FD30F40|nr:sulfatase-like hydrolase/transferase [Falsirhodobacter halotolerans]MCJ8139554.1 sulfatase-like hydrolase/transferase [Falsirhodobacter halotolerans]
MPIILNIATDDLFAWADYLTKDKYGVAPFGIEPELRGLKRLRARSTHFRRASAVIAVCMPSRAAVYSGMSPADTGIFSNAPSIEEVLRPEHLWTYELRRAGWTLNSYGKILHVVGGSAYTALPSEYYQKLYHNPPPSFTMTAPGKQPVQTYAGVEGGGRGWAAVDEPGLYDYQVAQAVIDRINGYDGTGNLYLEAGFKAPHEPWDWPQRLYDLVPLDSIIQPADWPLSWDLLPFTTNEMGTANSGLLNEGFNAWGPKPSDWTAAQVTGWKNSVRNYIVGVLWLSDQIDRVLDALEASPHNASTMIVFWGDHGYHLGDKGRFHKFTLWEEACNAAFMISLPGQTQTQDCDDPISLIDIGATICDYAGVPWREGRRGISLRPYLERRNVPVDRLIPSFWYGSVSASVGSKRISAYQDGSYEFFDVAADPWSANNLALQGGAEFDALREKLHAMAIDWGMQIHEEGATLRPGTPIASLVGYAPKVDRSLTSSFIVLGDLDARAESPNYKTMYGLNRTGDQDKVYHLPEGVGAFRNINTISNVEIHGNDGDNLFSIQQVSQGAEATVHTGEGNNRVMGANRRIVTHAGSGNDYVFGRGGGYFDMGGGNDTLIGSGGAWEVHAGAGNDVISLSGTGNDVVYLTAGSDLVNVGAGNDTVHIRGGSHVIDLGDGVDTVIAGRTGLPQIISGLRGGVLDLSDWSAIAPVQLRQVGADVAVTAGAERILLKGITVTSAKSAITGAQVL